MSEAAAIEIEKAERKAAKANTILYVDGVSVTFDGFRALNSLSFAAPTAPARPP